MNKEDLIKCFLEGCKEKKKMENWDRARKIWF